MMLAGKMACLGLILIVVIAAHMARHWVVAIERGGTVVTDRWTGRVYACWSQIAAAYFSKPTIFLPEPGNMTYVPMSPPPG